MHTLTHVRIQAPNITRMGVYETYASRIWIRSSYFTPPPALDSPAMSSAQPPDQPPEENNNNNGELKPEAEASSSSPAPAAGTDGSAMDTTPDQPPEETWEDIPEDIKSLSTDEILTRTRLIDNDLRVSTLELVGQCCVDQNSGHPLGNTTTAARTGRYEGEDQRQWRED